MAKVVPFPAKVNQAIVVDEMISDIFQATNSISELLRSQTEEHQLDLRESVNNQLKLIQMSVVLLKHAQKQQ